MTKTNSFDTKTLLKYVFPKDMLEYFDITDVEEEFTGKLDETGSEIVLLHIYLDEQDNRDKGWHDLTPNGFTEYRQINDFPLRDHKVVLHVRRRRWMNDEGQNVVFNLYKLVADGTSYSQEFAAFLKEVVGYLPSDGPLSGAFLQG